MVARQGPDPHDWRTDCSSSDAARRPTSCGSEPVEGRTGRFPVVWRECPGRRPPGYRNGRHRDQVEGLQHVVCGATDTGQSIVRKVSGAGGRLAAKTLRSVCLVPCHWSAPTPGDAIHRPPERTVFHGAGAAWRAHLPPATSSDVSLELTHRRQMTKYGHAAPDCPATESQVQRLAGSSFEPRTPRGRNRTTPRSAPEWMHRNQAA
jgi:hypothetical protein